MENLTPNKIVEKLDQYIIGQESAKKNVAVALRNRYRRQQLSEKMREEILPKNIIMIGPTGVGKTEIARRLAKLVNAPFVKVEATKYTEVGYMGRDVESMIRDLAETAIRMVREEKIEAVHDKAIDYAEDRLVELLLPKKDIKGNTPNPFNMFFPNAEQNQEGENKKKEDDDPNLKLQIKKNLQLGNLENQIIEVEVEDQNGGNMMGVMGVTGMEDMGNLQDMLSNMMPSRTKKRKMTVADARKIVEQQEAEKLIDLDEVTQEGINRVEQFGIVFLDEIDKIANNDQRSGTDVSRGGVQRDILPIVEGSTVNTKYGPVKTDHILFIAAGAFHLSKPSDLIPELQGRFPIRVELDSLTKTEFVRILLEPQNSLIKQYQALLEADGVELKFTKDGIEAIAEIADYVNGHTENIGARRLHTILEKVLEDVLYEAPERVRGQVLINREYVEEKLALIAKDEDLNKYIL